MSAPRNCRGPSRPLRASQKRRSPGRPSSANWQSFGEVIRAGPRPASVRAEMGIPAPLRDRRAARRRRAHGREPDAEQHRREADTDLPVSRWNLISAPLFRVSCRQKTAEQNYYNWFSRIETVPSWFGCLVWGCSSGDGAGIEAPLAAAELDGASPVSTENYLRLDGRDANARTSPQHPAKPPPASS